MKQAALIVAAVCVLGGIWLIALSPSEDSGGPVPDPHHKADSSATREAFPTSREEAPLTSGAASGPATRDLGSGYARPSDPAAADSEQSYSEQEEEMSRTASQERYEAVKQRVEAAQASRRSAGARPDAEPSRGADDGTKEEEGDAADEGTRIYHVALQTQAAEVALQRQLIPPEQLEQRVEQAVPDGSLPPDQIEPAREAAREELLAEELVLDYLTKRNLPEGASPDEVRRRRDLGHTLLSGQDQEYVDRMTEQALKESGSAP